jgi:hypothetical protein
MPPIKWILFFVFIVSFIMIVVATLLNVFYGIGHLEPYERKTLFSVFIVAIGTAIVPLFKELFASTKTHAFPVNLILTDDNGNKIDLRKYDKKMAICSPRYPGWNKDKENTIECEMQYDEEDGLILHLIQSSLPEETHRVYVTVTNPRDHAIFGGSFKLNTYTAELQRSRE